MKETMNKISKFFTNLLGFAVLVTICVVTYAVAVRPFKIPAPWSNELVKSIFIWLVFIGSAAAFQSDSLIGLDLVEDMLAKKPGLQKALKIFQMIFALIFGVFMTTQTWKIISTQITTGEPTPVLQMPLWLVNFGYFLGCALFAIFAVYKLIKLFTKKQPSMTEQAE